MARSAIARLEDVERDSVKLDADKGLLIFEARKGRSLSPDKVLAAIKATSFHSRLNYLEITVGGEIVIRESETRLQVAGTNAEFTLGDAPSAQRKEGEETPFARLKKAVATGEKVVSVSGRVYGWGGYFTRRRAGTSEPKPSADTANEKAASAKKPRLLIVTDFQVKKKEKLAHDP